MTNKPELSVVIVNWNAYCYLAECVNSIYAEARAVDLEIVLVDNASANEEAERIAEKFPLLQVVRSACNEGFAAANNRGFERASGEYILFLNPDTRVIGPAIRTMLSTFTALPCVGILGCKLLNADGTLQKSCVQPFPTIANQIFDLQLFDNWRRGRRGASAFAPQLADNLLEVEAVSGACLMIHRDTFERAGRFDEGYFMYAEDVDLCYRVRKLGLDVWCARNVSVVHYGGGSSKEGKGSEWVAVMQRKAIYRFCRKVHGQLYGWLYRSAMALVAVCRLLVIAVAFPLVSSARRRQFRQFSSRKWLAVTKWAFGWYPRPVRANRILDETGSIQCVESAEN